VEVACSQILSTDKSLRRNATREKAKNRAYTLKIQRPLELMSLSNRTLTD